jgi:hypothetical protein
VSEPCGDENPEYPGVFCEKPTPCYFVHQNFGMDLDWPGEDPPTRRLSRLAEMKEIADAIPREKATGPPDLREYQQRVRDPEWVEYASRVLHTYCREHAEPFTTAEHLWPLLDAPEEMRWLVQPVRRALRQHWMHQVDSRRLGDIYRSRDGVEFQMNKLVPVYRSLICASGDFSGPMLSSPG